MGLKRTYEAYIKLSVAMEVLFSEGIIPFNIIDGTDFTFVFRKKFTTKNIVEWLDRIFSEKGTAVARGFYVSVRNAERALSRESFHKKGLLPVIVFDQADLHSTWRIREDGDGFIVEETKGWADKIIETGKADSDIDKFTFGLTKLGKENDKLDFLKDEKDGIPNENLKSLNDILSIAEILDSETEKADELGEKISKRLAEKFSITMSDCIERSGIGIRNIFETILYNAVSNEWIPQEEKDRNIREAARNTPKYLILVDKSKSKKEKRRFFAKPFVSYQATGDGSPRIFLALSEDTAFLESVNFMEQTGKSLVFTVASKEQIAKICDTAEIDPSFAFIILLPDDNKILIDALAMKKLLGANLQL